MALSNKLFLLELVDCQDIGGDHDHHGDVEGEQGANHQEVIIVHFTHIFFRHDIVCVNKGQDRDGGGEEHAKPPGEDDPEEGGVLTL